MPSGTSGKIGINHKNTHFSRVEARIFPACPWNIRTPPPPQYTFPEKLIPVQSQKRSKFWCTPYPVIIKVQNFAFKTYAYPKLWKKTFEEVGSRRVNKGQHIRRVSIYFDTFIKIVFEVTENNHWRKCKNLTDPSKFCTWLLILILLEMVVPKFKSLPLNNYFQRVEEISFRPLFAATSLS